MLCFLCLAECLGRVCVHGCLPFCIPLCVCVCLRVYVCVCVCLAGNTIYALLYRGPKDTETYQGDISNSCPQRYWFPQRGPSRLLVPWVTPAPYYAQFPPLITKLGHFVWLLVIISNNWNLIWQSTLPERYWSHPEWDAVWNLVLFFYLSLYHRLSN